MKKQDLKVGIITGMDPADRRSWSGIHYHMSKALEEEFSEIVHLGPVKLGAFDLFVIKTKLLIRTLAHKVLFNGRYNRQHNHTKSKYHARFFEKKIQNNNVDVIFAPSASVQIAHLKTDIPVCYFADATFSIMHNYYGPYKNLSSKSIAVSNEIEQRAINKSTTQVFSSKWACDSAIQDYGSKNTFLVKMGANIDEDPGQEFLFKNYDSTINIVFIGVDWERKGGPVVLETVNVLDKRGYDVQLTVCGCMPTKRHAKMEVIPFLDKNKKDDMLRFQNVLRRAHLFFMPTRAECYGIVFCEANAFGLPVITTETGGVSSVIENGINGFMLPTNAKAEDYARVIEDLISNKESLKKLAESSRQKYLKELNWRQWGKEIKKILLLTSLGGNRSDLIESADQSHSR